MRITSPKVSVILPTYNRAHVLRRAVISVLDQTYEDLELCVVDDGSTDNTGDVLADVRDPRLRVVRTANRGACVARNIGIAQTSGQFVAFQDSDDVWLPRKLELQVERMMQAGAERVVAVGCGWELLDGRPGRIPLARPVGYRDVLKGTPGTGGPNLLVRRLRPQPVWNSEFPAMQERGFLLEYARRGEIAFIPEVLVRVDRSGSEHVASSKSTLLAYEMMLELYRDDMERWPDVKSQYHVRASREAAVMHERRRALHHFQSARRAQRPTLGQHFEFALGMTLGYAGLATYTRLRGRHGYS